MTGTGFKEQSARVIFDDLTGDRKTESGAIFFGSGKNLKQIVFRGVRDAAAEIGELDVDKVIFTKDI